MVLFISDIDDAMSSFSIRLKLDLSDIHPPIDNPIQWLFFDLNHQETVGDLARNIKSTYFQDRKLEETDIELFLEEGLIPPNTSLRFFKSDERIKVKLKKLTDLGIPKGEAKSLSLDEKTVTKSEASSSSSNSSKPLEKIVRTAKEKTLVELESTSPNSLFKVSASENYLALKKELKKAEEELSLSSSTSLSLSLIKQSSPLPLEHQPEETELSMAFISQVQVEFLQQLRRKLGRYGLDWMARSTIKDDKLMYECGTPDCFWIFAWTDALEELNEYIQVPTIALI